MTLNFDDVPTGSVSGRRQLVMVECPACGHAVAERDLHYVDMPLRYWACTGEDAQAVARRQPPSKVWPDPAIIGHEALDDFENLRNRLLYNTYMIATGGRSIPRWQQGALLRGIAIHLFDRVKILEDENEELRQALGASRRMRLRSRSGDCQ